MPWLHPLLLQAAPGAAPTWSDPSFLLMMGSVGLIFYFVLFRPQSKQASEQKALIAALKKGDRVVTQAGLFGKIVQVNDKDLILEVAVGGGSTKVQWLKSQIVGLDPAQKAAEALAAADQKIEAKPAKPDDSR